MEKQNAQIKINDIFKQIRKSKKIRQTDLAKQLNICPQTICNFERGNHDICLHKFINLCNAIECTIIIIRNGELFITENIIKLNEKK